MNAGWLSVVMRGRWIWVEGELQVASGATSVKPNLPTLVEQDKPQAGLLYKPNGQVAAVVRYQEKVPFGFH